jgi:hypothetical protein
VHLFRCQVNDRGLEQIGRLRGLKLLTLNDNPITDAGLEHLVSLKRLTTLRVEQTDVSEAGVKRLTAALPDTNIIH